MSDLLDQLAERVRVLEELVQHLSRQDMPDIPDEAYDLTPLAHEQGDIFVVTGPGMITRLPVGTDGDVLTANSMATDGVEWDAGGGGGGGAPAAHHATHEPGGSDPMAVDAATGTGSLRTLGSGAQQAAPGDDSRLSDNRFPLGHHSTHEPGGTDAMAVDQTAGTASLRTLGTGATQAASGNDTRLYDARTPTSHHTTHESGGADAMSVDASAGTGSLRTIGTGALQAAAGNDSRLSNSRTPNAHNTTHINGGGDEVSTATAAANAIPKAGAGGKLASGWISNVLASSDLTNDAALEKIVNKAAASGYASLDSGSLVVQDPVNATATPTASKIVKADGSGKLVAGWGGSASTLATLNGSSLVVQDPANATSTATASKIVKADGSAHIDTWISTVSTSVKGLVQLSSVAPAAAGLIGSAGTANGTVANADHGHGPTATIAPDEDIPPTSPDATDQEFNGANSMPSPWGWIYQGAASSWALDVNNNLASCAEIAAGTIATGMFGIYQAVSGSWIYKIKIKLFNVGTLTGTAISPFGTGVYAAAGIFCADGSTSSAKAAGVFTGIINGSWGVIAATSSGAALSGNFAAKKQLTNDGTATYLYLQWDGSKLTAFAKENGIVAEVYSDSLTNWSASMGTPTAICIGVGISGLLSTYTGLKTRIDYIRKVASTDV